MQEMLYLNSFNKTPFKAGKQSYLFNNGEFKFVNPASIQVFSPTWFRFRQPLLLWLLNNKSSFIRNYFRFTLGISKDYEQAIVTAIYRDCIHFYNDEKSRVGLFFSKKPFTEKLYYGYLPLWKAIHGFDKMFAEKFFPELDLGFATLTAYPQSGGGGGNVSCDGFMFFYRTSANTWAFVIGDDGTNVTPVTSQNYPTVSGFVPYNAIGWQQNYRGAFSMDTSSLGSSTLNSANIFLTPHSLTDTLSANPTLCIFGSTQANANTLVAADYARIGNTPFSDTHDANHMSMEMEYTFTLNSSGIANINKTGVSKFGLKEYTYDYGATTPPYVGSGASYLSIYNADSGANIPRLEVAYSVGSSQVTQMII